MRRRRRRAGVARTYSIRHLLLHQPKTLKRHPQYREMIAHYDASEQLRRLRFSRRCYTLLNQARIAPENLSHFYRTYRLPSDPFFPLFFAIKRSYLAERERIKEERRRYIHSRMRELPPVIRLQIKYLGYLERYYNAAGLSPVWQKRLFPTSKKRADMFQHLTPVEWQRLFRDHLALLVERYPRLTRVIADRVLACLVLGMIPELIPPARPAPPEIARTYRRLSMLHHPDRGGDPTLFISIKRARDVLVNAEQHG